MNLIPTIKQQTMSLSVIKSYDVSTDTTIYEVWQKNDSIFSSSKMIFYIEVDDKLEKKIYFSPLRSSYMISVNDFLSIIASIDNDSL